MEFLQVADVIILEVSENNVGQAVKNYYDLPQARHGTAQVLASQPPRYLNAKARVDDRRMLG